MTVPRSAPARKNWSHTQRYVPVYGQMDANNSCERVNRGAKLISPFMGAINILHIVQHCLYSVLSELFFCARWNFKFISRSLHPGEQAVKFVTPGQMATLTAQFRDRIAQFEISSNASLRWQCWLTGAWLTVAACAVESNMADVVAASFCVFTTWKQSDRELCGKKANRWSNCY